ncbi:MAG: hypothetical protein V4584_01405 [Verrucomicrobiota bacterium]
MYQSHHHPSAEPAGSSAPRPVEGRNPPVPLWIAGVRYPNGTEIWCAYRGGEAAWTTDRRLAAKYQMESSAAMAARHLTDGGAVPFWTTDDAVPDESITG